MQTVQSTALYLLWVPRIFHCLKPTALLVILWIGSIPLVAQEEIPDKPTPIKETTPPSERYSLDDDDPVTSKNRSPRPAEPSAMDLLLRVGLTLVVLIGVLVGMAWIARRFWPGGTHLGRGAGPIRILARTGLPPRHTLYLLRVGRRILLVGATGENLSTLTEITDSEEVAHLEASAVGSITDSLPPGFQKVFSGKLEEFADDEDSPPTIPESLREI